MGRAIDVEKRLMKLELEIKDLKNVVRSMISNKKPNKESKKRLKEDVKKEFREAPSSSAAYFPYKERQKEK